VAVASMFDVRVEKAGVHGIYGPIINVPFVKSSDGSFGTLEGQVPGICGAAGDTALIIALELDLAGADGTVAFEQLFGYRFLDVSRQIEDLD
jgi:hypothetical protein